MDYAAFDIIATRKVEALFNKMVSEMSFDDAVTFKRFSGSLIMGAKIIKKKAVASLNRIAAERYPNGKLKFGEIGRKIRIGKNDSKKTVSVNIMYYMLRWFEKGTKQRYTKTKIKYKKGEGAINALTGRRKRVMVNPNKNRGAIESMYFLSPLKTINGLKNLP
jgi:hypothetical protein